MSEIKDFEKGEFPEHNEYVYVFDDVEHAWTKHGFDRSMGIYKFWKSRSGVIEHLPVNRFHKWSKEKPMSETKTKYRVGFVLQEAKCLNCDFQMIDFVWNVYDLKEEIFALAEKLHTTFAHKNSCEKREMLIRFGNAVREI